MCPTHVSEREVPHISLNGHQVAVQSFFLFLFPLPLSFLLCSFHPFNSLLLSVFPSQLNSLLQNSTRQNIQRQSRDAILAQITTPTGLCGSICPDVQEIMSPEFGLHISVAWPSLDVPSSALGIKKHGSFGLSRS